MSTMRWILLLAALMDDRNTDPLCFDEPDLALHPDTVSALAALLKKASQHRQIMVTTHNPSLVDHFHDDPAAVVVVEKDEQGGTAFRRLDPEPLGAWLKEYRLGEMWTDGHLGGTQW